MKRFLHLYFISVITITVGFWGCNSSEEITGPADNRPVITFDAEDLVYKVKQGRSLLLEPTVLNNENAAYRWLLNGAEVGREASYLFSSDEAGRYYITFEVSNPAATVFEEIRIDVLEQLPPYISLAIPEAGLTLLAGTSKEFKPVVANSDEAVYSWKLNGEAEAETKDYTFRSDVTGEFSLEFTAVNEDGEECVAFTVTVLDAEDMPFSWEWEKDSYAMGLGRTIVLAPLSISNLFEPVYSWYVDGGLAQQSDAAEYSFTPGKAGTHSVTVTLNSEYATLSHDITVDVYDDEDKNLRPVLANSNVAAETVWEFLPAPGQFVNDMYVVATMPEANSYAQSRLKENKYVSLGAFGGYIIVQFDHSVMNDGDYNIQILGNSFDGSSEPGIVWVMQDENGDGIPNDTWYELKGSEHGRPGTLYNYAVTYYRPSDEAVMDYLWTDNRGNEGVVERNRYHGQPYYPKWVTADSYTLRGTRLESRVTYEYGKGWRLDNFDWGYADNFGSDILTDGDNHDADVNANHFKISHAVDANGNTVNLKYIDFVKIQTGIQSMAGNLGEGSTEVYGIRDYNMVKGNY